MERIRRAAEEHAAALRAEVAQARDTATQAQAQLARLEAQLAAVVAERDQAQQRVAQLTGQVSDLAAALASLGAARDAGAAAPPPAGEGAGA